MKLIAFILSFYIVVLTLIPCVDIHYNYLNTQIEISDKNHNHDKDHSDNCSPLCTCNCCSVPILLTQTYIIQIVHLITNETVIHLPQKIISSVISSLWQPPKF
jgi:hypothetical protein